MGKAGKRKFKQRNRDRNQKDSGDGDEAKKERPQGSYKPTVRENAKFEEFYKTQGIVPEGEWDDFMSCVKEPLPAAFRVTGSKSQAELLLHLIQHDFFSKLKSINGTSSAPDKEQVPEKKEADSNVTAATNGAAEMKIEPDSKETSEADASSKAEADVKAEEPVVIKPPTCLNWYPDGLAWQLEYSRVAIRSNNTLKKLHSFLVSESESGNISRQEAVSMIPPLLMDIKSHHKILDMCAAPGSKTAQIIEYLHADTDDPMPEGFVIGNDLDNRRCYLMVHQVKRLQSPNLMIINHDATQLPNMSYTNPKTGNKEPLLFDRILCDVPCSGDGTLRKNPEVWRKWGPGHAINLHSVQNRVLQRGLELLAVGGRLVYSTCSFNPIENEAVIAHMINKCEGSIRLVDCSDQLPELKRINGMKSWKVQHKSGDWFDTYADVPENKQSWVRPSMFPQDNMDEMNIDRCIRILPHHQNTGGFFIAILEKTGQLPWLQKPESKSSETTVPTSDSKENTEDTTKTSEENSTTALVASPTKEPPNKRIKYAGFREDPFYYLDKNDSQWPSIKQFYGFDDTFDSTLFMVRSKESEKKRNIYLSAKSMKDVALCNERRMKYINTGVKVLARSEHELCKCSYRLVQDGILSLNQFITSRRVEVLKDDVITLLTSENPFFSQFSRETSASIKKLALGGLVMMYKHKDSETGHESEMIMTGWRGKTSCRVYVPKFERHHVLRLCGIDPDEALIDAEWAIKGKTAKDTPEDGDTGSADEGADIEESLVNKGEGEGDERTIPEVKSE